MSGEGGPWPQVRGNSLEFKAQSPLHSSVMYPRCDPCNLRQNEGLELLQERKKSHSGTHRSPWHRLPNPKWEVGSLALCRKEFKSKPKKSKREFIISFL